LLRKKFCGVCFCGTYRLRGTEEALRALETIGGNLNYRGMAKIECYLNFILFAYPSEIVNLKANPMNYSLIPEAMNELSQKVIGHAYNVHTTLGPGLLESTYKECLFYEIAKNGIYVEKEKALPLIYKEIELNVGYRIDLLVENKLVVEVKSVDALADIHAAQTLTYLKLSGCRLGLLINFNVTHLKTGIRRLVL